jgi:hypothetical protein
MKRTLRLAQWAAIATGILLLFWVAAAVGGWSPGIKRLTSSVHGLLVGDYRAESPQMLAPLSSAITQDASRDQASAGRKRPGPTPSGGPIPSASGSPTPSGSSIIPTVPPVSTPTVPVGTPTLPVPTPPPTPTLPTPPPLP